MIGAGARPQTLGSLPRTDTAHWNYEIKTNMSDKSEARIAVGLGNRPSGLRQPTNTCLSCSQTLQVQEEIILIYCMNMLANPVDTA